MKQSAFDAVMGMKKIEVAAIKAARLTFLCRPIKDLPRQFLGAERLGTGVIGRGQLAGIVLANSGQQGPTDPLHVAPNFGKRSDEGGITAVQHGADATRIH